VQRPRGPSAGCVRGKLSWFLKCELRTRARKSGMRQRPSLEGKALMPPPVMKKCAANIMLMFCMMMRQLSVFFSTVSCERTLQCKTTDVLKRKRYMHI